MTPIIKDLQELIKQWREDSDPTRSITSATLTRCINDLEKLIKQQKELNT